LSAEGEEEEYDEDAAPGDEDEEEGEEDDEEEGEEEEEEDISGEVNAGRKRWFLLLYWNIQTWYTFMPFIHF